MDAAQAEARAGIPGNRSPHRALRPDRSRSVARSAGKHVVTIDVNSQPYTLADGSWDEIRDEVADRAIAKLGEHFNLPGSILERQVMPPDLERVLGIWGGHALHGEMAFDQLFNLRPVRGWGVPDADPRPLALRGRHPPRRRRDRSQRAQLRARGARGARAPRPDRGRGDEPLSSAWDEIEAPASRSSRPARAAARSSTGSSAGLPRPGGG